MCTKIIVFLFLAVFSTALHAKLLPDDVLRCSKSDPKLTECLKKTLPACMKRFSKGFPDLSIPLLEPFLVNKLDLGKSNAGSVSLHQIYNNLELYGLSTAVLSDIKANFTGDSCGWSFYALNDVVEMVSDYTITGQLLVFPINGHGKCKNTLYGLNVLHEMSCERYTKKGKKHLRVLEYKFTIEPKSVHFNFSNIIDGNEQLSNEVLKTMNENALSVFSDVRGGFAKAFSQIWKNVGNTVFSKVPEDDLFLP